MRKLKIILKYNLILIIAIIYSFLFNQFYIPRSKFSGKEKIIKGYVREIKTKDNLVLTIKSKEKIIVYYNNVIKIDYNDYIVVRGNLEKPKSNTNFNMFNYKKYLNKKKINYIMYADNIIIKKKNKNIFY